MADEVFTILPDENDIVIEGTAIAVVEERTIKRYQVTITTTKDYEKSLANVVVDAPDNVPVKDVAFTAVKNYMIERFLHGITRLVFRALLDGVKPQIKRINANKFVVIFKDANGDFVQDYTANILEL